ncbi:spore coat protein CotJB [Clostridia bacterium]|nr:spore coat protein CotJB [Clostridia bacterium]
MTDREKMMRRIASTDFAITELHLFLDTHPEADDMRQKLNYYKEKSETLKQEFEEKYGSLTKNQDIDNNWTWISDPWPWDNEEGE